MPPPMHSVTSSPVSSKWTPPRLVPSASWTSNVRSISRKIASNERVLQPLDEADDLLRIGLGPHFDAHGVADAAEELDVRAVERPRALADPREVGREVVVAGAPGNGARLGRLVVEVQPLVAGEEVDAGE